MSKFFEELLIESLARVCLRRNKATKDLKLSNLFNYLRRILSNCRMIPAGILYSVDCQKRPSHLEVKLVLVLGHPLRNLITRRYPQIIVHADDPQRFLEHFPSLLSVRQERME